jgi:hypothetical protein
MRRWRESIIIEKEIHIQYFDEKSLIEKAKQEERERIVEVLEEMIREM